MTDQHVPEGPRVRVFDNRTRMGAAAAAAVADELRARLARQPEVRMVFAAAPSQQDMLGALAQAPDVDWSRVSAFHMDEYLGLPDGAPQRFGRWLSTVFFDRVPLGAVHLMDPDADPDGRAYAELLGRAPVDLVCLGIGENGHLAFNDPPAARLDDPRDVAVVELDGVSRSQQVADGLFGTVDDVPTHAITLTVPRLLAADRLFCVVPGAAKRQAVTRALHGPLTSQVPASALRTHADCTLFLDAGSAPRDVVAPAGAVSR
ncbi:6-phosphogluconolactonase [Pseudonocardia sp. ICBG1293]|uniref:6-phosphogluconolactonase n=1 Tax=Pseudonocardia sp. ICBG1293 TaxID=2844382 RepID=UPI001CCEB59D|nr:6-phosphogluconolactonase [Pseudonocardia sp. ICBG1293]